MEKKVNTAKALAPEMIPPFLAETFWARVDTSAGALGRWYYIGPSKQARTNGRRPTVIIGGKKHLAYRVAYVIHNDEPLEEGVIIRHSCHDPECLNPRHISKGNHKQNLEDSRHRGMGWPRGMRVSKEIRSLRESEGLSKNKMSELTGVSRNAIRNAETGATGTLKPTIERITDVYGTEWLEQT